MGGVLLQQRIQRASDGRGCGVFKNLRKQMGGRGKNWGRGTEATQVLRGQGKELHLTLREAPGERVCRGENGGREVRDGAPAGILVLGRLRDAGTVRVTWG